VRATTVARIDRLRAKIGAGCPACRDRPQVWILGEDDPEPPDQCERCGRRVDGEVYVYVGIDPDVI
jgi:Zn ribbon nucleic-acid-binding protein